ncbi:hypothetical protein CHUAL_010593 [Chamberlinius hualienensis]
MSLMDPLSNCLPIPTNNGFCPKAIAKAMKEKPATGATTWATVDNTLSIVLKLNNDCPIVEISFKACGAILSNTKVNIKVKFC